MTISEFDSLIDKYGAEYFYENFLKPIENKIFDPIKEGFNFYRDGMVIDKTKMYLTVRACDKCIYTMVDKYDHNNWTSVRDDSYTIYYKEFDIN